MNEEALVFADGKRRENAHAMESGGMLHLYFQDGGETLKKVYSLLRDAERLSEITGYRYGQTTVYSGYTHLAAIREEGGGLVTAMLRKEEA